jgi:hypothetical protein
MSQVTSGGGNFIAFGSSKTLTCPLCRRPIEISEIVEGKHDAFKPLGWKWTLIGAIINIPYEPPFTAQ